MKKLFSLIGVFIGIYLVFFFFFYADNLIFPTNTDTIYECGIERSITSGELTDIAEKHNVTVFTNEYNNCSFFNTDIVFYYFNISDADSITMGRQNNLIPTNNITYQKEVDTEKKIQRFWAIENEISDFVGFEEELKDYKAEFEVFETFQMGPYVIFSSDNIRFFSCIVILLSFCISVFYMLRKKEIAIYKLNGYSNASISMNIAKIAVTRILIGYILVGILFSIYVFIMKPEILPDYALLILYISISIVITMIVAMAIGTLFIKCINIIAALKSSKNNKSLLILSVAFKLVATIILVLFAKDVYFDALRLANVTSSMENAKNSEFYYINTSNVPDDATMESILTIFDEVDNDKIYTYRNDPIDCLNRTNPDYKKKREAMYDNPIKLRMSHNMLDYIPIYSENGELLKKDDFDRNTEVLLIPSNLKDKTDEILSKYRNKDNIQVSYIERGQEHINFLYPGTSFYNAIYYLKPIERSLYVNGGEVLYHQDIIDDIQNILEKNNIDSGTVNLICLSSDNDIIINNAYLELSTHLQYFLVNFMSFILSVVAIGIVYCEFRKKEIAVYKIMSVFPTRVLLSLCGVNMLISLLVTLIICPAVFFIPLLEVVIYVLIFNSYYSKKTVTTLKGE